MDKVVEACCIRKKWFKYVSKIFVLAELIPQILKLGLIKYFNYAYFQFSVEVASCQCTGL